jgi:hypothetical protein
VVAAQKLSLIKTPQASEDAGGIVASSAEVDAACRVLKTSPSRHVVELRSFVPSIQLHFSFAIQGSSLYIEQGSQLRGQQLSPLDRFASC